jgi:hypothetical protein
MGMEKPTWVKGLQVAAPKGLPFPEILCSQPGPSFPQESQRSIQSSLCVEPVLLDSIFACQYVNILAPPLEGEAYPAGTAHA